MVDTDFGLVALEDYAPLPQGESQYAQAFIQHNEALVLARSDGAITVGLVDAGNAELKARIRAFHALNDEGLAIRFATIEKNELYLYLGKKTRTGTLTGTDSVHGEDENVFLDRIANDAPVVNLVNSLILQAYNEGASDIHLDPRQEGLDVRFRIDGILTRTEILGRNVQTAIASRIKVMAGLNIMERRLPQDGRCSVTVSGRSFDLRVSTLPGIHGESLVLRLLRKDTGGSAIAELGFSVSDIARLSRLLTQPHGLFLATGPTGSGKTTSLHGMITMLPAEELKIITLEDPVEYQIPGITQVQINEDIGLGFESTLRRVLRQDPDVIMVGEIRDHATAALAVRAALTGHLVLSSLHTNAALESVARMVNLGVEPYLLAAVLRGILGQRLVRSLCPHCAKAMETPSEYSLELEALGIRKTDWPGLREPTGCERCKGTGFSGRVLLYELVLPGPKFREAITSDFRTIDAFAGEGDFRPLNVHAAELLREGRTSLGEIRRTLYI